MARIVRVKNASGSEGVFNGQTIAADAYHDIQAVQLRSWQTSDQVFAAVASGDLVVNDGDQDITDPLKGWNWIEGEKLPESRHLEGKLAVHSSSKPEPADGQTYAVWAGSGDDINAAGTPQSIGGGDILLLEMTPGNATATKDVWFDPYHGRVWLHEAYIKFEGAGAGDYLQADIMAPATQLQQAVNLDLVVDGDGWITLAPGGPGTGTHGFAATPSLLPRDFSMDGDWDYDGTNLTPNLTGEGGYKINSNEMSVHRYFNHIPLMGNSYGFATMSSDETAYLPIELGYFIRVTIHNVSDGTWNLSCIMEIFRERTVDP